MFNESMRNSSLNGNKMYDLFDTCSKNEKNY